MTLCVHTLSRMWPIDVEIQKVLQLPDKELKSLLRELRKRGLVAKA